MRRRLLVLASLAGSLVACASILGDLDVEPAGSTPDGSTPADGGDVEASANDATTDADSGPLADKRPIGLQVATSTSATCATVQYPSSQKIVTYCWGAEGAQYPYAAVGASAGDPNVDGFYRPRLVAAAVKYLTFSSLTGAGTGEWFVGRGTDGQTTATYAWGSNKDGECAAGDPTSVMPTEVRYNGSLQFDSLSAGPNHGCGVAGKRLYCWGSNTNCELRAGPLAACNAETPILADQISRGVDDESTHTSGKAAVIRVALGLSHACRQVRSNDEGLNADDTISCWGGNLFGQANPSTGPFFVDPPADMIKVKRAVAELAAGENHSCAISNVGEVKCWGRNNAGQSDPKSADATVSPTSVEVPGVITKLRAAGDLSCAVSKQMDQPSFAYCWGNGPRGRAAGDVNAPIGKIAGIQDVSELAIGRAHACAVAKKEGATESDPARVWCWGTNEFKRVDPRSAGTAQFPQPVEIAFPDEPAN